MKNELHEAGGCQLGHVVILGGVVLLPDGLLGVSGGRTEDRVQEDKALLHVGHSVPRLASERGWPGLKGTTLGITRPVIFKNRQCCSDQLYCICQRFVTLKYVGEISHLHVEGVPGEGHAGRGHHAGAEPHHVLTVKKAQLAQVL